MAMMLGFYTRYASAFFFVAFSYFTFIDKTLFNNHLYLFMLLALLLVFVDSERCYSLRNQFHKKKSSPFIDSWQINIFRFLIFLVYFYGGIVKFHSEWLGGGIAEAALKAKGVEDFATLKYLLVYGGLIYDLAIGFLLLYKPTRMLGVILVLCFNLTNHFYLFDDIGVFPFTMIAATIVFFDPNKVAEIINNILGKSGGKKKSKKQKVPTSVNDSSNWNGSQKRVALFIGLFVAFQLLFPFRYLFFTNNPEWSGVASRFAWRMKMQTRNLESFKMTVQDLPNGTPQDVDYKAFLSVNQQKKIFEDPYNVVQLGQYIAAEARRRGLKNPSVRAEVEVSFNGRAPQLMIKPEVPLEQVSISPFENQYWLMDILEVRGER